MVIYSQTRPTLICLFPSSCLAGACSSERWADQEREGLGRGLGRIFTKHKRHTLASVVSCFVGANFCCCCPLCVTTPPPFPLIRTQFHAFLFLVCCFPQVWLPMQNISLLYPVKTPAFSCRSKVLLQLLKYLRIASIWSSDPFAPTLIYFASPCTLIYSISLQTIKMFI